MEKIFSKKNDVISPESSENSKGVKTWQLTSFNFVSSASSCYNMV